MVLKKEHKKSQSKKRTDFPHKLMHKTRCMVPALLFNIILEILVRTIMQED
jgi:hypothetical protein